MKTLLALLLTVAAASAQNITKVTTVVVQPTVGMIGAVAYRIGTTNVIDVPLGEAARISFVNALPQEVVEYAWAEKDELRLRFRSGDVIAGPVRFYVTTTPDEVKTLTLERWKVAKR